MIDETKHSIPCHQYFNDQYSKDESYWGDQPNLLVPLVSSLLKPGSRILDVGCGEGRDTLFLARCGFEIVATEIAEKGIEKLRRLAEVNGYDIELACLDAHSPHDFGFFDCVLLMGLMQYIHPERIAERMSYFQTLVKPGGIISVEVFTVEDPCYHDSIESGSQSKAALTLEHPARRYSIRYFEKHELVSYFSGWEMIYYHEGLMWDKPHGVQIGFHQHGLAQMIARKMNNTR